MEEDFILLIEVDVEARSPEFTQHIGRFDDLGIAGAMFKMVASLPRAQWSELLPTEAGDGNHCDRIRLILQKGEFQDAVGLYSFDLQESKQRNSDDLEAFIKSTDIGTMRKQIGKSTWMFTRAYSMYGTAVCTIEETVDGAILNALYDETADNCLAVFENNYNEGY